MLRFSVLAADCDRIVFTATPERAETLVRRRQAVKCNGGRSLRLLGTGVAGVIEGGGTRTASGGLIPRQVYTTRGEGGRVDGFKHISPVDLPVFYSAILGSLA